MPQLHATTNVTEVVSVGDKLSEPFDGVGNIYEIYILGERTVFTCNPDYIKVR